MNIGIIGAGSIGSTLARKLVQAGHSVKIANSRGPETLGEVAAKTGAAPVALADAVKGVQVVLNEEHSEFRWTSLATAIGMVPFEVSALF
ncbi:NAD(P)-binding domain-containing protein [Rhizobium leguminosarum]|uniref:NAD(P)-binding domain-containing protein n=1 Tax=Rhizobium leguminosarum TaxID=384 RepID=UPI000484C287